ncbi:MAG: PA domain-containing protein [Saprospiraceae bacterium]
MWTGDVEFVDDGTANPNEGCSPATNDLTGKIALIDRGSCEFGVKCLNAENAGAIAVVVFNHTAGAGAITMAPGAVGDQVMIPCVMLSYEDGQTIRNEVANGTVNMTIGMLQFDNNLTVNNRSGVVRAPAGVMPANQVEAGYLVSPGAMVTNSGLVAQSNVTVAATIDHDGNQIYSESAGVIDPLEPDSSVFIALPDVDVASEGMGKFTLAYEISSDSIDALPNDNSVSSNFFLSQNVFCKASWDEANNRPTRTTAFTIADGGDIEFLSGFHVAKGEGYRFDSIQLYVATNAASLGVVADGISAYLYWWQDLNADEGATTDELTIVGITDLTFPDTSLTGTWLTTPILDFSTFEEGYEIPLDDMDFFVGVRYQGPELVFFGFDENYDQTQYTNNFVTSDLQLPYIGINGWDNNVPDVSSGFLFTDFFGSSVAALVINPIATPTNEVAGEVATVHVFPNPASGRFTAEVELPEISSFVQYDIRDAAGRLMFSERKDNLSYDKAEFDATTLAAGQYFLVVRTEKGSTTQSFSVQH